MVRPAPCANVDSQGVAPLEGEHHGRLALEQLYGYMVEDRKKYGVLTTVNGWMFLFRQNGGILYHTPWMSGAVIRPTIRQALYYISAVAVTEPHEPEKDRYGQDITLPAANAKKADRAPQVPGTINQLTTINLPPSSGATWKNQGGGQRYNGELVLQPDPDFPSLLFQKWIKSNQLGNKAYLATFMPEERVVVGKFWDAWRTTTESRDNEVQIYMKLQSLWGTTVPAFLGCAEYEWRIALFIERIEVTNSPLLSLRHIV
jgi:hypothetical protein